MLILAPWTFSEAASNHFQEANNLLNGFNECNEIKFARFFLPCSFCICATAKNSSLFFIFILWQVMNSETSKLLRSAVLGVFVVVDTWSPDVSGEQDLCFWMIDCTYTFIFEELVSCMFYWLELVKMFGHFWWYIWTRSSSDHEHLKNALGQNFLFSMCPF